MIKNISNLGDAALYCDFGKEVNKDINTQVIKYFKTIQKKNIAGVNNITPSYNKLIISFPIKSASLNEICFFSLKLNLFTIYLPYSLFI